MKLILIGIVALVLTIVISIAFVVGVYWLICLCFGLTFNYYHAIGIYLIILLLKGIFSNGGKN